MTDSPHGARVHTQRQLYLLRNLLSACLTAIGTPCMISLASSSAPLIVKERTRAVVEVAACGGRVTILPHTFLYTAISFVPKSVVEKEVTSTSGRTVSISFPRPCFASRTVKILT